jgi:hypothetical protein
VAFKESHTLALDLVVIFEDAISKTQESREPEDEIALEPLTGQVGGMRVMVGLEGDDARLWEGGEGPGGWRSTCCY